MNLLEVGHIHHGLLIWMVLLVFKVIQGLLDKLDHLEIQELLAKLERLVKLELLDKLDHLEIQELLAKLERLVKLELLDKLDHLEIQEQQVHLVTLVLLEIQGLLEK